MYPAESQSPAEVGIRERYLATRGLTVDLCATLEIEDFIPQPIEDVSPAKWNIAHTTWFFEEMILKRHDPGYREFDPQFGFLFNSYYNTLGERTVRSRRGDLSRPTVSRVFEYRKHVDEHIVSWLEKEPEPDAVSLLELGINHEQQHQELLLTDLKYVLSLNPIDTVFREGFALVERRPAEAGGSVNLDEGMYEIGFEGEGFCFDNELERHKAFIGAFEIDRSLVTNADFLEFIGDGGYSNHRLWHSEGWDWVRENNIEAPLYWKQNGDGTYSNFTMSGTRRVIPEAPVAHVSYFEAAAFAEWKGRRLPTEFEWEAASDSFEWGLRWEWTSSAYLPYPGFKTAEGAVGEYNGKFMVNQMTLRGASCATSPGHSRTTYRNFFNPHLRWQFTGIRLAN